MPSPSKAENSPEQPSKPDPKAAKVQMSDIECPNCQKNSRFNLTEIPNHFPFCSMRCKSHDLGEWLTEDEEDEDEDDSATNS